MVGVEGVEAASIHERGKVGVPHLLDLATGGADQVGVGHGDALLLCLHSLKHMPPQHLGVHQQLNSIVHG